MPDLRFQGIGTSVLPQRRKDTAWHRILPIDADYRTEWMNSDCPCLTCTGDLLNSYDAIKAEINRFASVSLLQRKIPAVALLR